MRKRSFFNQNINSILKDSNIDIRTIANDGILQLVDISLSGKLAVFPSTSNNREIGYRNYRTRSKPFIRKSKSQLERLEAAKIAYVNHFFSQSLLLPRFNNALVIVSVFLCSGRGIRDSHNYSKPIGDWLEDIGLIDNDKDAEIHCYKQSDYPRLFNKITQSSTYISICKRDVIHSEMEQRLLREIDIKRALFE